MIFLTVGTEYPFDRLVKAVDESISSVLPSEEVFAQIGPSKLRPQNLEYVKTIKKTEYDRIFRNSCAIISHAGMGTIISSIQLQKPLLVMPRLREHGEHVNDHQLKTAKRFEQLGYFFAVYEPKDVPEKLKTLHSIQLNGHINKPKYMISRIKIFLDNISSL